jgi:leader peptidase (prepilin peptidase)/N-methyltransferase
MSTPNTLDLIRSLLILILLYLSYIDLRSFRLPDFVTLPLILIGILFNLLSSVGFTDAASAITGAVLGYGSLWLLNRLYRLSKKQDGIGMGDAKLLAALGAWLGWAALPSILLIASASGLIGGLIYLKWRKKSTHHAFPFGPFLAFAGIIELLWPQHLLPFLLSNLP